MDISHIVYYKRVNDKGTTVPLRDLNFREDFFLEDLFYAVRDSIDEQDFVERFRRICYDQIEYVGTSETQHRYVVTDVHGNINYLKLTKRKEK